MGHFDHIFTNFAPDSLSLIKIDTEGAELDIIKGGMNTIQKYQPKMICEINGFGLKQMGTSEREFREFMAQLGYHTYLITPERPYLYEITDQHSLTTQSVLNVLFCKEKNPIQF